MKFIFDVKFERISHPFSLGSTGSWVCAKGFLKRWEESDLISDTNTSPLCSGIPLWLQMPRMCGTNPKDLARFPPHLPSALNPLLGPLCWKFLPLHTAPMAFFFLPALCPVAPDLRPVPVCLWLIVSPSLSLLCLPPAAYTLIILRVASCPGADFNFCCTSPVPVLGFYNLPSSCSFAPLQQRSWPWPWNVEACWVTCFQCWTHRDKVVYKMLSDYQVTQPILHCNINNNSANK